MTSTIVKTREGQIIGLLAKKALRFSAIVRELKLSKATVYYHVHALVFRKVLEQKVYYGLATAYRNSTYLKTLGNPPSGWLLIEKSGNPLGDY